MSSAPPPFLANTQAVDPANIAVEAGTLGNAFDSNTLLLLTIALGVVAAISIAAVIAARREARFASRVVRARGEQMRELLRTIRMAESIANLGVWQYDPGTGVQQWSDGMRRLFGIEHNDPFVAGDAETLLFANNIDLVGAVKESADQTGTYTVYFDVFGYDGTPRSISVQACNLRDSDGAVVRVVAVVHDATEEIERQRELEHARAAAVREASRARELAATDPLTGLANRRRVMDQIDQLIVEARLFEKPLILVVFDIDHFKFVNDTYGHPVGDKVLKRIARIAKMHAREGDIIGRVGGEEFVWIIPAANQTVARIMSERLRQTIAAESGVDEAPAVTISLGFAQLESHDTSLSLFARADGALYAAKHAGRNRVRVAA